VTVLTTVTLERKITALPDDGDHTEICWSCFNPYPANVENMVSS